MRLCSLSVRSANAELKACDLIAQRPLGLLQLGRFDAAHCLDILQTQLAQARHNTLIRAPRCVVGGAVRVLSAFAIGSLDMMALPRAITSSMLVHIWHVGVCGTLIAKAHTCALVAPSGCVGHTGKWHANYGAAKHQDKHNARHAIPPNSATTPHGVSWQNDTGHTVVGLALNFTCTAVWDVRNTQHGVGMPGLHIRCWLPISRPGKVTF